MCGISGFVGQGSLEDLARMNARLQRRGPDAEGVWTDESQGIFLGHRRLSILDIEGGAQPMRSPDGDLVIVFNGEIYNFQELRRELTELGHRFVSDHSDTEVLLNGYRQWGFELPTKLNGMWAFAIYDRAQSRVFCSRDRFGEKPFYYSQQARCFAFASELTALEAHPALRFTQSDLSLKKYFAYGYIPAPRTIYEEARKLPAGHNLCFDLRSRSLREWAYWDLVLDPVEPTSPNAEKVWCEELRSLLEGAVKRRLVADVPVGIFLSGGVDSSAVAALATRAVGADRIQAFSVGFNEKEFDESAYASQVARHLGIPHSLEMLSVDAARDSLARIAAQLDEPMGDSSLLPTYLLCQSARKHVTVALGGDGADELFAGYAPFKALEMANLYSKFVGKAPHRIVMKLMGTLPASHGYMSLSFKLKQTLRGLSYPPSLWNAAWLAPVDPAQLQELFCGSVTAVEEIFSEAIALWNSSPQADLVDRSLQFYIKLYMQSGILAKVDRASMMNSLEVRSPFLDIELVNFVRRIPSRYKIRSGQTKYLLKKSLEPLLPIDILYRSKHGFAMPVGDWFRRGELKLDSDLAPAGLDRAFIARKTAEHMHGKQDHRLFLWNEWILERWLKERPAGVFA